jgi:hypothetical protein
MKITTESCIKEIDEMKPELKVLFNPKWKRISKTGNAKDGYVRVFEAKECPELRITVKEWSGSITEVKFEKKGATQSSAEEKPSSVAEPNGIILRKVGEFLEDSFEHVNFIPQADYKMLVKEREDSAPEKEKVKAGTKILMISDENGFVYYEIEIEKDATIKWYDGWSIIDAGGPEVLKIEDDPRDMALDAKNCYDFDLKAIKTKYKAQRLFTTH